MSNVCEKLRLIENGQSNVKIVYSHKLDDIRTNDTRTVDIEVQFAEDLAAVLGEITGTEIAICPDVCPEERDIDAAYTILIGDMGCRESTAFRTSLGYAEYGFKAFGSKIVISGTNLTTTERAVTLFADYAREHVEGDEGCRSLTLCGCTDERAVAEDWMVDLPEYTGGKFFGTHDADMGNFVVRYTNTTPAAFEAYCGKLEKAGYTLWQRNDIVGNLHAFYTGEKGLVCLCYTPYDESIRISTAKAGAYVLPESVEASAQEKVTDSILVQLACDYTRHEYGMGYIVVLENGSFVIFDGGDNRETYTFIDRLYEKLCALNKRPDGKIVIEGWFISHIHVDHYGTFAEFCYKYGKEITIKQVLVNTASRNYAFNSVSWDRYLQNNMQKISDSVEGGVRFVQVRSGMRFSLANADFEILHTTEDLYPQTPYYFNDTSIVWRMTLGGQTSMWTGDIAQRGSTVMCRKFGEYLKSDIVQVSHHGYVGATVEFYALTDGKTCLFPINQRWYDMMIVPKFTYYAENIEAVNHADEVFIAEVDTTLNLPYRTGEAIVG